MKKGSRFYSFKEKILKKEGRGFTYKEPKEVSKKSQTGDVDVCVYCVHEIFLGMWGESA